MLGMHTVQHKSQIQSTYTAIRYEIYAVSLNVLYNLNCVDRRPRVQLRWRTILALCSVHTVELRVELRFMQYTCIVFMLCTSIVEVQIHRSKSCTAIYVIRAKIYCAHTIQEQQLTHL